MQSTCRNRRKSVGRLNALLNMQLYPPWSWPSPEGSEPFVQLESQCVRLGHAPGCVRNIVHGTLRDPQDLSVEKLVAWDWIGECEVEGNQL